MQTLRVVLIILFIIDAIALVIAVLLQSGRGGGLAGALGGIGGGESALGVRAASQIEKATGVMAGIFLGLALAIALLTGAGEARRTDVPVEERGIVDTEPATDLGVPAEQETMPETD